MQSRKVLNIIMLVFFGALICFYIYYCALSYGIFKEMRRYGNRDNVLAFEFSRRVLIEKYPLSIFTFGVRQSHDNMDNRLSEGLLASNEQYEPYSLITDVTDSMGIAGGSVKKHPVFNEDSLLKANFKDANWITLVDGVVHNMDNFSKFPIENSLIPRFPIVIKTRFTYSPSTGSSMLWRFGTSRICSQAYIASGRISADFRNGNIDGPEGLVGYRNLSAPIDSGYHEVILTYDGNHCILALDNAIVDSVSGFVDISTYEGELWIGKNAFASDPAIFSGTISKFQVCMDRNLRY